MTDGRRPPHRGASHLAPAAPRHSRGQERGPRPTPRRPAPTRAVRDVPDEGPPPRHRTQTGPVASAERGRRSAEGRASSRRRSRNPYLRDGASSTAVRPSRRSPQGHRPSVADIDPEARPSALRRLGRGLGLAGGGVALLGALAIGLFPTQTFLEQRATTNEVEERLEVLRAQNEAFEDRIEALQTDEEIERLAREQYNLAYPGEEAYAVLPAPLPPLDLPPLWPYGEIYDPALSAGEVDASLDAP